MANEISINLGVTMADTPGQNGIVAVVESLDRTKIWSGAALVPKSEVSRADWADGALAMAELQSGDAVPVGLGCFVNSTAFPAALAVDPPIPLNIDFYFADDAAAFIAGGAVPAPVGYQAWPELQNLLPAGGTLATKADVQAGEIGT